MFWVDAAERFPHYCAVSGRTDGPLIDTGNTLAGYDPRVYVGPLGVDQLARFAGWTSPAERLDLDERLDGLERENADLSEQIREADKFADAAEYTLSRFGQKVQKKPGRPPARKEAA